MSVYSYDLHGLREISEFTGLSSWKIRELVRDKKIPVSKMGGIFIARRFRILKWIEDNERESYSAPGS
ncbi:MAG TPA: hypothetical protein PK706_10950 [Xanthobacteraceae bacterium]|jgi:hypothetical protein|nr:hypothetical protein [Xanthobacteraceae bacterium]